MTRKTILGTALSMMVAVSTPSAFADRGKGGGHGRGHGRGHAVRVNDHDRGDRDFRRTRVRAVSVRDARVVRLRDGRVVSVRDVRPVLVRDRRFVAGRASMRFRGLDTNRDGLITRREWRGNDNSFRVHDRNGDGILSGFEVRTGDRRRR